MIYLQKRKTALEVGIPIPRSVSACKPISLQLPNRFHFHTLLKRSDPKLGPQYAQHVTHGKLRRPGFELAQTVAFNGNADRPVSATTRMAPTIINMRSDSQTEDGQIVTQLLQK